jgi:hypothetical protein
VKDRRLWRRGGPRDADEDAGPVGADDEAKAVDQELSGSGGQDEDRAGVAEVVGGVPGRPREADWVSTMPAPPRPDLGPVATVRAHQRNTQIVLMTMHAELSWAAQRLQRAIGDSNQESAHAAIGLLGRASCGLRRTMETATRPWQRRFRTRTALACLVLSTTAAVGYASPTLRPFASMLGAQIALAALPGIGIHTLEAIGRHSHRRALAQRTRELDRRVRSVGDGTGQIRPELGHVDAVLTAVIDVVDRTRAAQRDLRTYVSAGYDRAIAAEPFSPREIRPAAQWYRQTQSFLCSDLETLLARASWQVQQYQASLRDAAPSIEWATSASCGGDDGW